MPPGTLHLTLEQTAWFQPDTTKASKMSSYKFNENKKKKSMTGQEEDPN